MQRLLVLALTCLLTGQNCHVALAEESPALVPLANRVASVSASDEVMAVPDKVVFSVIVESDGASYKKSVESNEYKLNELLKQASALGFVPTQKHVNLSRESSSFIKMSRVKTYRILSSVKLEAKTLKSVSDLAFKIVDWDDIYLREIHFENSQIEEQKNSAFKKAFEKAKARAQFIAKEAGLRLGKVIRIADTYTVESNPNEVSIVRDSIKVSAKVDLSYELLD